MFAYYLKLAIASLRKHPALTALMVVAIGVGIGACMTALTVFRAMAGDPIPQKSVQLFAVQVDNWGPTNPDRDSPDLLSDELSYRDAMGLMQAGSAYRQSALYLTTLALRPADSKLKASNPWVRAAYSDFFSMFDVPFKYGRAWSRSDDERHLPVIVISSRANDSLFAGQDSTGRTLNLGGEPYTVVGVLKDWSPVPHFYDLRISPFRQRENYFIPLTHALDKKLMGGPHIACKDEPKPGFENFIQSECVWMQFWVELPSSVQVADYRRLLDNYAAEQRANGRFNWPPHTRLRDVREWLSYRHVVPNEVNILSAVAVGFLAVCLLNASGLMLARIVHRVPDISVRRALGANRRAVFLQCLVETGLVGVAGGALGLLLTVAGLAAARAFLAEDYRLVTELHAGEMLGTLALSIIVTVLAGLYPTWRATSVQPAWQLKAP